MLEFSLIGVLVALGILMVLIMRGVNIFLAAVSAAFVVAVTGGLDVYTALKEHYMTGFVGFFKAYFLIFLVGAIMGKFMEASNGAAGIAQLIIEKLGDKAAVVTIPIAASIIAYGGVNVFVVVFAVFPIALQVYKKADIPRRFIPGAIFFGMATFAMVAPGTPQIQNIVPTQAMKVPLMSGIVIGFVATFVQAGLGCYALEVMVKKAKAAGEHFVPHPSDVFEENKNIPNGWIALIPLIITLVAINVKIGGKAIMPLEYGVGLGAVSIIVLLNKDLDNKKIVFHLGEGVKSATMMIFSTCAVVGFGSVVKAIPAFPVIVNAMVNIPGSPLIGAAVGSAVICGITGSASGGLGIAAPLLAPAYLAQNVVSHGAVARVMAIASSSLDSMPHNGAVVAVIDGVCHETHKTSYFPLFVLSVLCPIVATIVALVGFTLFPSLP